MKCGDRLLQGLGTGVLVLDGEGPGSPRRPELAPDTRPVHGSSGQNRRTGNPIAVHALPSWDSGLLLTRSCWRRLTGSWVCSLCGWADVCLTESVPRYFCQAASASPMGVPVPQRTESASFSGDDLDGALTPRAGSVIFVASYGHTSSCRLSTEPQRQGATAARAAGSASGRRVHRHGGLS